LPPCLAEAMDAGNSIWATMKLTAEPENDGKRWLKNRSMQRFAVP
jgi:hypothetical protein